MANVANRLDQIEENIMSGLKDFQRKTVDYVFDQLYGAAETSRFLVADEVGLGKTLMIKLYQLASDVIKL